MIPTYLKIKGLYSYQKEQEIQFNFLTEASLFGIFGSVGSGKSSILEAITFALYGDTERLNKAGDDRTYNMMNLRSDELLIDFECIAGRKAEKYRFTVKGKRNLKNFKEVKTFERRSYRFQDDQWIPLTESETTEHIIGLSYDNFRRTIIIPQGRFQEFIELRDAERTRMMKELFQLEKYDLSRNVGSLNKQNDIELSNVEGQLLGLGEVTSEMIVLEEKKRDDTRIEIRTLDDKLLTLNVRLELMQRLMLAFQKIKVLGEQLQTLELRRPDMDKKAEEVRLYEICSLHFKSLLEKKRSLKENILNDQSVFTKNQRRIAELGETISTRSAIISELKPHYDGREELLLIAEELKKVIRISNLRIQLERDKAAQLRGQDKLKEKEVEIEILRKRKSDLELQNETRKSLLTDLNELSLVKSWFATSDEVQDNKRKILKEADDLQLEIGKAQAGLSDLMKEAEKSLNIVIPPDTDGEGITAIITEFLAGNQVMKEAITRDTLAAKTRQALHQYAEELNDGEPCPLCGSVHHPLILDKDQDLFQEIDRSDQSRRELEAREETARRFQSSFERAFLQIVHFENQKSAIKVRYRDNRDRVAAHDLSFVWDKFDKNKREDFDVYFSGIEKEQKDIRETEISIKGINSKIDAASLELTERIDVPLRKLGNDILTVENTIATLAAQLSKVRTEDFAGKSDDELTEKITGLQASYKKLKEQFESTEKELGILQKENDTLAGGQQILSGSIETNGRKLLEVQKEIDEQLIVHGFGSEDQVELVIAKAINLAQERKVLEEFKSLWERTKRDLENLREESLNQPYDPVLHEQLTNERDSLHTGLTNLRKEEGRLEGLIKQMTDSLARKEVLVRENSRLLLRKEHLDDLARLFRSSGFVDYASSIYLQNLIQAANHRFHQMTYQQLHLELGEGNSFLVRDLLNGGHLRLLKTLSGGQKFQAALSLALALADHIHVRNESKHNFFFLDEGFGSLDKNSLQTVFETLKSLRKENRIVGIISHVEELQQEIQTYLRVEATDEGSRIIASWE